ncbi:MAG: 3-hydroxyacyl-CoA dehydrogenase family protein [Chitinophagaceae bacterium]|nr:3-hydroxyacyl-CoA dehydrogenase family protein [Chitinophagaceae bacterium]
MNAIFYDPHQLAPSLWQHLQPMGWHTAATADWGKAAWVLCMQPPADGMWAQAPQAVWLLNDVAADVAVPADIMAFRFCGWPGFTDRAVWELAACSPAADASQLPGMQQALGVQLRLVANVPGLVAPRVLACIINEACFGLAEGICTAADMDTAMKLGTNYPQGPVSWAQQIGPAQVQHLLQRMAQTDPRYQPHPQLLALLAP